MKTIHEHERNTKKNSYLDKEEFYIPHAFSLYIFNLCSDIIS
jgi:hypothetical protein